MFLSDWGLEIAQPWLWPLAILLALALYGAYLYGRMAGKVESYDELRELARLGSDDDDNDEEPDDEECEAPVDEWGLPFSADRMAARSGLQVLWNEAMDEGAPGVQRMVGAVRGLKMAGVLSDPEAELWIRRSATCPENYDPEGEPQGHFGGRSWCAYCGDTSAELAAEEPDDDRPDGSEPAGDDATHDFDDPRLIGTERYL